MDLSIPYQQYLSNRVVGYILNAVKKYNTDVIILGELFDKTTRLSFKKQLGKGLPGWKIVPQGEATKWTGQLSGGLFAMYRESGHTLVNSRYHILAGGFMQDSLTAKGIIGLQFQNVLGEKLWVCATHLQYPDAGYSGLCH